MRKKVHFLSAMRSLLENITLSILSSSGTSSTVTLAVLEGVALALETGVLVFEETTVPFFFSFFTFFFLSSSPENTMQCHLKICS